MSCFHPIRGVRLPGGQVLTDPGPEGEREIAVVACGRCIGCLERRGRDWAVRMTHEAQGHERNCFVTLTLNEESLPKNQSLDIEIWKKFAKRLRKRKGKFRYFQCGEYGPQTLRPHWHACLFSMDFEDRKEAPPSKSGAEMWTSKELEEIWGLGNCTVQDFTMTTAAYVAGYVVGKDFTGRTLERVNEETGEVWTVKPETATMSRNPGLGANFFKKYCSDIFPHDYVVMSGGKKMSVPRYYDKQLDEETFEKIKKKRKQDAWKRREDETEERRKVREQVAYARRKFYHGKRM